MNDKRKDAAKTAPSPRAQRRAQKIARKWRVWFLASLLVAGAGAVLVRAYEIQIERPSSYARRYRQEIEVQPRRGNIYDRNGNELAVSVDLDSFFVDPLALRNNKLDPAETVRALAKTLKVDAEPLVARATAANRRFLWIKRRVTPSESQAVEKLGLVGKGVGVRKEPRRFYPNVRTAAHVLGFTDDRGQGVEGIERTFETSLRGAANKASAIFDARGGVVFSEELVDGQNAEGHDLTLTIDRELQVIAERELELGVRAVEARAGHVVVMDPSTGEILALANYPTFNPNAPGGADPATRRNRALSDRFEPGSVMKTFTIAGALAAGAVSASQVIDCENGALRVADAVIHDSHRYDKLTVSEILAHSSNIGTAKIGAALGRPGLYKALRQFGFGARTELELPSEADGVLRDYKRWYEVDAATIAFGQGVSINNVQLATAMSAVANGGKLMKPMIVARVRSPEGKVEQLAPSVRRQVVPAQIARQVSQMLTAVTEPGGTGEPAAIEGFAVAGKTGTAQKAGPRGGYADNSWTSTFVGFVPAERPRLVVSVVIDEPVIEHYGGQVAGPVFRRIASESLQHLGILPAASQDKLAEVVKQLREQRTEPARESTPKPTRVEALQEGKVRVPNLAGKGARAALVELTHAGLAITFSGSGTAVAQRPRAGAVVDLGATVHLVLQRPSEAREITARRAGESAQRLAAAGALTARSRATP